MDARLAIGAAPAPPASERTPLALYLHVPFCATKCPYCDFNTYAGIETLIPAYAQALTREIALWGRLLDHPRVSSVFVGGGTPSYLPAGRLKALLEACSHNFRVEPVAEITFEANPDDLTPAKLETLREAGANRLSIGIQSLNDRLLGLLRRRHDSTQAVEACRAARRAGFGNVNVDLMFGLPGQSHEEWADTINRALGLAPDHVSAYGLQVEPGTPLAAWIASGTLPEPDSDAAADMYDYAEEEMARRGYAHYEISNWAAPGMESRHNLAYWLNAPYLGVGPGAHSALRGCRFANLKSPRQYVRRLSQSDVQASGEVDPIAAMQRIGAVESVERLTVPLDMADTMMLGLRLAAGISAAAFARRFGRDLRDVYGCTIDQLVELGLLKSDPAGIRLSARGRLLGNEVFQRFIADTPGLRSPAGSPDARSKAAPRTRIGPQRERDSPPRPL